VEVKDVIHSTSKSRSSSKKKRKETIASMELGKIKYWYNTNLMKRKTRENIKHAEQGP